MKLTTRRMILFALLAAPLVTVSLDAPRAKGETPSPSVHIDNFTFTPQDVTVSRGTTVRWVNDDDIPHTVAATNKAFRSKAMDSEETFSFKFDQPGTYEYFCALHPHMQGKVIVTE